MDQREAVRRTVLARDPVDDAERESIARFVELYDRLDDPFDEHADPVHVTGSAIVVGRRGVVLHRHKRLGIWLQPGGHVDPGESPAEASLREAREETGLGVRFAGEDPELVHVDVHPGPRGHTHLDLRYLLTAPPVEPTPGEDESPDVRWFGWEEAMSLVDARLAAALAAIRDSLGAGRAACDDEATHGGSA